ncbi:MAG: hypothetical protein ACLFPW_02445 [Spirochaetaceae bacterium]
MKRVKNEKKPERFRPSDTLAMIIAALQIILPIVVVLLLAAALVYGAFLLFF